MDLLAINDHDSATIIALLQHAGYLADRWRRRDMPQTLLRTRVCMIVNESGWRTTTAFELGVRSMGGICIESPIKLGGPEPLADIASYLDNWFDIIVARAPALQNLQVLAISAEAPVINARTRVNHPCEILGDLAFILRARGSFDRLRVAVIAPEANILNSWREAAAVLQSIFQPFSRGSLCPSLQGLRPGLYISHNIAEVHGGTLGVVSTQEETRFTFRMPLVL